LYKIVLDDLENDFYMTNLSEENHRLNQSAIIIDYEISILLSCVWSNIKHVIYFIRIIKI